MRSFGTDPDYVLAQDRNVSTYLSNPQVVKRNFNPFNTQESAVDTNSSIASDKTINTRLINPQVVKKNLGKTMEQSSDTNSNVASTSGVQTHGQIKVVSRNKNPKTKSVNTNFKIAADENVQQGKPGRNQKTMYASDYNPGELSHPVEMPPPLPTDKVITPSRFKGVGNIFDGPSASALNPLAEEFML